MDILAYPHKIEPFDHQREHLVKHWQDKSWALFWEQGTAKTKPIIDTAAALFNDNKIDGLIVVAPPGVERNWATDEITEHLPDEYAFDWLVQIFQTKRKLTKTHKRQMESLFQWRGLSVLLISYDASMTKEGKALIDRFLRHRVTMMVLDEAHNIKSPGAKRTMSLLAKGKRAKYRRILTGTPIAQGPFDVYSQIKFIDEWFWKNQGIHTYAEFKNKFGRWFTAADCRRIHGYDPGFDRLLEYQNIEQLYEMLQLLSDRHTKDDVLDLPPKLYQKRYFELTHEQRVLYNTLKEEMMVQIGDHLVTAELPIVRLLRHQQIACNYIPVGEDEPVHMISAKNPRLKLMEQIRDETYHPCIVWARFRHDVDQLMDLLGEEAVRYDGSVDYDQAERNKEAFQAGDAKWFVGTQAKGGSGLTLTQAKTMVYYSNSFKLIDRLQSEDRAHRAGMDEHPVNYIDLVASDTVDERIIDNLRNKKDIASAIQGDDWKEWI